MNTLKNIVKSALLGCALFLLPTQSSAQSILELIPGSKRMIMDENSNKLRLIGNVNFLYQGNKMYCDSAHYFEKKQIVHAYGRVHINKRDTLNLFCDSLHYNGKTKLATLWGNVRLRDNEYKLTTDELEYDAKRSQAVYKKGGRVESILSREVLTSRVGYFHPESKNFFFSQNVDYRGKDIKMTTDTLRYRYSEKKTYFYGPTNIETKGTKIFCEAGWYNTESEEGELRQNAQITRKNEIIRGDTLLYLPKEGTNIGKGNVFYSDSTQKMSFQGDYALISDSLHYTFLTGHALAVKELKDDTMYVHADTLYTYKEDSVEYMRAYQKAAIYSTKFQCIADSISYAPNEDKMELFRDPIVWSNGAELKGDSMELQLTDSILQKVLIKNKSSVIMSVDDEKYFNQIGGKEIIAYFKDNDLYQTKVNGNAVTIFYPEEETKTDTTVVKERQGMNRLFSSTLRIDIDSNEVSGITYLEEPDGVFYPIDQIDQKDQFIQGFDWKDALRPRSPEGMLEDVDLEALNPKESDTEIDEEEDEILQKIELR
ncbi:MAG: OstA-like protein [Crocinitomicaceae bacterium]